MNLRAALFRCLNELKKNGALGREAVLRKTMLDECKGDKFEEVLVLFSVIAVRHKLLTKRRKQPLPLAQSFGMMTNVGSKELALLAPLAIAHRFSLNATLQKRAAHRSSFMTLSNRIEEKRHQLNERFAAVANAQQNMKSHISKDVAALIKREVQQNWVGNSEGCRLLLDGGKTETSDTMLTADFSEIWGSLYRGTPLMAGSSDSDIIARLDHRIQEQKDRLRQWKDYRDTTSRTRGANAVGNDTKISHKSSNTFINLFDKHQTIRIGQDSGDEQPIQSDVAIGYSKIVADLKRSLQQINQRRGGREAGSKSTAATVLLKEPLAMTKPVPILLSGSQQLGNDLFSPLKQASSSPTASPMYVRNYGPSRQVDVESCGNSEPGSEPSRGDSDLESEAGSDTMMMENHTPSRLFDHQRDYELPVKRRVEPEHESQTAGMEKPEDDFSAVSEPDALDDQSSHLGLNHHGGQIDAEISQEPETTFIAPPESTVQSIVSDRPCRPSLAERTRMSMAFTSSEDTHQITSSLPKNPHADEALPSVAELPQVDRRASLADRALQSMTLVSLKSHTDIKRHRSKHDKSWSSIHPINQFETPVKPTRSETISNDDVLLEDSTEVTPRENLFSEEAEYESVFKSRPKIGMSSVMSPSLDEMSQLDSSPLGELGGGRRWGR